MTYGQYMSSVSIITALCVAATLFFIYKGYRWYWPVKKTSKFERVYLVICALFALGGIGYLLTIPMIALTIAGAMGDSSGISNYTGWLGNYMVNGNHSVDNCGEDTKSICYYGEIFDEGLHDVENKISESSTIPTDFYINSSGGSPESARAIGALLHERGINVHTKPVDKEGNRHESDCASACVDIIAKADIDHNKVPDDARLQFHMTRKVIYSPGLLPKVLLELGQSYVSDNFTNDIAVTVYGAKTMSEKEIVDQKNDVREMFGDRGERALKLLELCGKPDPFLTIKGIIVTWGNLKKAVESDSAGSCSHNPPKS